MHAARTLSAALALTLGTFGTAQDEAATQEPKPTFTLSEKEMGDGWHVLFDGTSTDAWRSYGRPGFPEKGWGIADGTLHHAPNGGGGDIITRRAYRNFELAFEWKIQPGGNSGVMYRVVETEHPSYWSGPEYQVLDDAAHGGAGHKHHSGALYGLYAAEERVVKPAGEWNEGRIRIFGNRVEHWLNGTKLVDAKFGSDDWNARVGASKFKDWEGFGVNARGHLCLQDHGNEVWYRNVRCRELQPETERFGESVSLFDGTPQSMGRSWFHLSEKVSSDSVWSVKDGALTCVGKPRGYFYSNDKFEDFVLTLGWRFDAEQEEGNSGVLLRATGDHKIWPRSIEAQLQSGRAGDLWNIGEFPMRTDAARTDGRNTRVTHNAEKPVGAWNQMEVICDDGWIAVRVNGQLVNEAWGCEDVEGFLGFQLEGTPVSFDGIRVTRLRN
ncbi:MAG: 3-keto-disaccharide hydrolase [Planctomycetota bacterium]